ncbi:hypothetical protein FVE85_7083 [Porphyridium purpureum]|uniref:Uncharacterized protein ycf18 n=1 Tax=Porphyridium purpureum TaxID=35688 RepID=A0A5J4Z8M3_PORPP|nr:hypothetical protein FVE85_7083 [Porphyridium purpureum]|eukprot:POR5648..scf295_1
MRLAFCCASGGCGSRLRERTAWQPRAAGSSTCADALSACAARRTEPVSLPCFVRQSVSSRALHLCRISPTPLGGDDNEDASGSGRDGDAEETKETDASSANREQPEGLGPEDRAATGFGETYNPAELTLEQQLQLKRYQDEIATMPLDDCLDMIMEIMRQFYRKQNLISSMLNQDIDTGDAEIPNPRDFMSEAARKKLEEQEKPEDT